MAPNVSKMLTQVQAYDPVGNIPRNIRALLIAYLENEVETDKNEIILSLREDLPPEVLYCDEVLSNPHQVYRILRDYLSYLGLTYRQHPENNRVTFGLPAMFYSDQDEVELALSFIKKWQHATRNNNSSVSQERDQSFSEIEGHPGQPAARIDASKTAHNVATRFRNEDKFSGAIEEDIQEYIKGYEEIASDYDLSDQQKLTLFHNLFRNEPKRFYRSIAQDFMSYDTAKTAMIAEYSGIIRQNRVRKYLQTLRLANVLSQKQCTVPEALSFLRDKISQLAPQAPPAYRTEDAKVEYLYKAVVGTIWAKPALSMVYSSSQTWTFQKLYTALDAAYLQEQEESEGKQRDGDDHTPNETAAMLYEGQGMYGIPRRRGSKSSIPFRSKFPPSKYRNKVQYRYGRNGADHTGKPRRCNNCQSKDHLIRECNEKRNLLNSVVELVDEDPDRTEDILFEVCMETEDAIFGDSLTNNQSVTHNPTEERQPDGERSDAAAPSGTFYELLSNVANCNEITNFNDPEDF